MTQVLAGSVSVAHVWSRTSKVITDLLLSQTSISLSRGSPEGASVLGAVVARGPQLRIPVSVRGFALHKEAGKLMSLLRGHAVKEDNELDPSPRNFAFLCCWIAPALGYELEGIEQLDVDRENEDLSNLHTRLQVLADAGPSCPSDEYSSGNSDSEVEITTKKTFGEFAALVQIARKTMTL
ncbi:hypothetical protein FPCIR_6785 [Fusarium pseudocircinatum]|uniref:Uncharacterized protein n=1 Tax=Fusarium pseudocircinatum TaxID=56676 RepID=A0A8H5LD04_9HYPO|nr:hypothetical protein FPCIR_6785 [Fusarium pseudocircinatum]